MIEALNLKDAINLILDKVEGWINTSVEMLPNFVVACAVVVVFWIIARITRKGFRKLFSRVTENVSLIRLGATIVYISVIAVGTFVALSILHLDKAVTSLLAGVGVVGLALGFAFQDIAANFVAGVLIATRKPFAINDLVETNGFQGTVIGMNLRASTLRTFQGQDVIIPNKQIFQNPLINYTIYPKRRIDLDVGVSYGDDLEKAKNIALEAINSLDIIDQDEEVSLFYSSFGDSSVNFTIRYWVDEHKQAKFLEARSEGVMAIKKAFDSNKITIPFPIRTLDFGIKGGKEISNTELHVLNGNHKN